MVNGVPSPHFSETASRKRVGSEEEVSEVRLVDHVQGIYEIVYTEVWISTEDTIPTAKHGNHNDATKLSKAPADGTMPSYSNI